MKGLLLLLTACALAACDRRLPVPGAEKAAPPFPEKPPVIDAQPVDTKSYDAGYQIGYPLGVAAATARARVPSEEDVLPLAAEAAGDDPTHNKKWRHGWTTGYLDGFRTRSFHTK